MTHAPAVSNTGLNWFLILLTASGISLFGSFSLLAAAVLIQ
jgi:hypothetical protein